MEVETEEGEWILDSNCTYHLTSKNSWFVAQIKRCDLVYMGINNQCEIIGRGWVLLRLTNKNEVLLRDVRHVPKLKGNLISLGMLNDQECTFIGEKGTLKIEKEGRTILIGKKSDDLYVLKRVV